MQPGALSKALKSGAIWGFIVLELIFFSLAGRMLLSRPVSTILGFPSHTGRSPRAALDIAEQTAEARLPDGQRGGWRDTNLG